MITQHPNPTALDYAIRAGGDDLAKIAAVKARFAAAVRQLQVEAIELGVTHAAADHAGLCAEDIMSDLFFLMEDRLTESVEDDERLLERVGG